MGFTDGLSNNLSSIFDWNSPDSTSSGTDFSNNSNPTASPKVDPTAYSAFGAGLQELFADPVSFARDLYASFDPIGITANAVSGGAVEGTYGGPSNPLPSTPPKTWIEGLANGLGWKPGAVALVIYGSIAIVGLFAIGYAVRSVR